MDGGTATGTPSVAALRDATYKRVDAWWTVFVVDPIAIRVVWLLLRLFRRPNPNAVTLVSLVAGLAAGALFATGHWVLAAITYQVSFLLDCVDGKLARWRGVASPRGGLFDGMTNTTVYVAALVGMAARTVATGDLVSAWGVGVLLALRAITLQANLHQTIVEGRVGWEENFASTDTWLSRHRLLPPFSFPDKHALLFLLGPLTGTVGLRLAIAANVLLELALLARKLLRVLRVLGSGPDRAVGR